MKDENPAKKESQSMALLQKLIRVNSKDCNFHFRDELLRAYFKVSYQQTNIENNTNEILLRQFWHHVYAHYFKKIQPEEIRRLQYCRALVQVPTFEYPVKQNTSHPFLAHHPDFDQKLNAIFSESYLSKVLLEGRTDKELDIWLKSLYTQTKSEEVSPVLSKDRKKKTKLIYSTVKQNRKQRQGLKNNKLRAQSFKKDEASIDELINGLQAAAEGHMSELDRYIQKLQQQKSTIEDSLTDSLNDLQKKLEEEELQNQNCYSRNIIYGSGQKRETSKDLECMEYLVKSMEEKQIAESLCKIIGAQRYSGELMFKVQYEKAMNIDPKLQSEKELARFNKLRETSLINFYRTGVKSLFSFICHNYVGFRELMQNRQNITVRVKDKDLWQMMRKGACLASLTDIQHEMAGFSMCHHCKFLYQDHLLFTCKFASDKQAIPKMNADATCDPNIAEMFQQGPNRSRTSQRFMTRKKNCLTSYAKIHDEYVCGRKYCFSCLKDTYAHENIKQNGLCPFCLGVCICTRCLRSQKIAKFKTMYSIMGGDLGKLQQKSLIDQLQVRSDQQISRGRGRPKKYMVSHVTVNTAYNKLRRFDMSDSYLPSSRLLKTNRKLQTLQCEITPEQRKKVDSANQTQEEVVSHKRRIKRKVGRPRLNKSNANYTPPKRYQI